MTGRQRLPSVVGRLPKARAALEYAQRQHAGQRRSSDGAPFIEHPLEVGWLLYRAGAPDHVIGAGVLHDFAADKVSKVRELRAAVSAARARHQRVEQRLLPPRRLTHFTHCVGMLEERLADSPLVELLKTELDGLNRELETLTGIKTAA